MSQVTPEQVLAFWFEAGPEKWFRKDTAFDDAVAALFGDAVVSAADGDRDTWATTPQGSLALTILLDQFPRNLHRNSALAFAHDAKALAVAKQAIEAGHDVQTPVDRRVWYYMPFMHSEVLADQQRCVDLLMERLPDAAETLNFAILHKDLIERFGRFPHRNVLLGRQSTGDEEIYLSSDGAFSG